MTKYIVWDWDGTLADTYPVINGAYAYTFEKLGMKDKTISFAEVKKITSTLQNRNVLEVIFGDKKEEAARHFYDYIRQFHCQGLRLIDGACAILRKARAKGCVSVLFSNKTNQADAGREAYLTMEVKKLGLESYFAKIVGAGEQVEDKPLRVASLALFSPDTLADPATVIYVVGDGEADLLVGEVFKKQGCQTFSILFDPENKYQGQIQPDLKISKLADLEKVF